MLEHLDDLAAGRWEHIALALIIAAIDGHQTAEHYGRRKPGIDF